MGGCNVAARFHLFAFFVKTHAPAGRYRLPYRAEAVYVRCVRGVRADSIEFHLVGYRVVDLVVALSHGLLVLQRAVGVVVCGCRVAACIHLFSRFIQAHALAYCYCFSCGAKTVNVRCIGGVFADRVEFHLVAYRIVDHVIAFADCLLVEKRSVFVVVCCCRVAARIQPVSLVIYPARTSRGHRLSYRTETVY